MTAATIDELELADDPGPWQALGFALEGGCCMLGGVRVRLTGSGAGRGIIGWSVRGLTAPELDGLPTRISSTPPREPAPVHANGVLAIDHVVAMTPALDRTVEVLRRAGLDLRRVREEPTPAGAPRQAFFRLGAEILEVVQEPEEVLARREGEPGPARFWGLALVAADIERAVAAFGEHAGELRDAVQPGRRIATVRRSAGLSVPLAVMSSRAAALR